MFTDHDYWFKTVFNPMIRGGDLGLAGDYLIVELGGASRRSTGTSRGPRTRPAVPAWLRRIPVSTEGRG